MATRNGHSPAKGGSEPGGLSDRKLASNALKEEAERQWAESDRKAAKGRRRTESRAQRRRTAGERDAEIQSLKRKLAQAERDKCQGPGRTTKQN